MRKVLYILLIISNWAYSQSPLDAYDFNQHLITYDTASSGMYVGYYYPPRWIEKCDTTTGTWTYTIQAGNGDNYFAINDSLITINSTPTIGTYYLMVRVANSTGWYLQDTCEIRVYDADICVFLDDLRAANSWDEDSVYFLPRGESFGYMNVNVNDNHATIGAWGIGDRPILDSVWINSDSIRLFSLKSLYGFAVYTANYRDSLFDCEAIGSMGNAAFYLYHGDPYDYEVTSHYLENCIATDPGDYHAFKISSRGSVLRNCIGSNSTDGHGFSMAGLQDIRYCYAYSNNQAGVECAGDSTYIGSCTFKENLYGVLVQDGTGYGGDTISYDTIQWCYISNCYDSSYSAIELVAARYTQILNNYLDSNHIDSWIYNEGDDHPSRNITYRGNRFSRAVLNSIIIDNDTDTVLIYYNIFDSINAAVNPGVAIDVDNSGTDYFRIYNNTLYQSALTCYANDVEVKNTIAQSISTGGTKSNNIITATDTIYVDQSTGNYGLGSNATNCIDQGTDVGLTGVDFYNVTIPQNSLFDIGASEYETTEAVSGTYYYRISGQNYYMKLENNDYTLDL